MKFLVDRCAGRRIATWLSEQGHDVILAESNEPDPGVLHCCNGPQMRIAL